MSRAFILLLDSFGVGALPDAEQFGDTNTNTLLHIAEACAANKANSQTRQGALKLPNLNLFGLNALFQECWGKTVPGLDSNIKPIAAYGYAAEISKGKDTTSGHWEIAGVPVLFNWGYFPKQTPCFPQELIDTFIKRAAVPGVLGLKHASGTDIIKELGDEHVATGKPILYTSADSVFQIAYHEGHHGGLERLYALCKIARELVTPYNIARVIARPFIGAAGNYTRTENRHDYSLAPPSPTLLDKLKANGGTVIGIGKIPDIFAHQGLTQEVAAHGHIELFDKTLEAVRTAPDRSLTFTNFVDFDMKFGHRRDVAGYAQALEELDTRLPELQKALKPDDIVILTADHGCDPTYTGTDHTREYIPILVLGNKIKPGFIGKRKTFADIGQSLANYFGLTPFEYGENFVK
jgi:phosphopentomutase